MALIVPVKCKLCGTTIKPPEIIIGEDPRIGLLKQIQKMATHLQRRAEDEARDAAKAQKPHWEAFALHQAQAQNLAGVLMSRCFDLSPELEAYAERERARLAATIRKTTVTDKEIEQAVEQEQHEEQSVLLPCDLIRLLKRLRDRYEELGDYAPPQAETLTPGKSVVG